MNQLFSHVQNLKKMLKMSTLSAEIIVESLKNIPDPASGGDIVKSGVLSSLSVDKGRVVFCLNVSPESVKTYEPLRQEAERVIREIKGVQSVMGVLTAEKKAPSAPAAIKATHKVSTRPVAPDVKHMIAVASGKGGVGKSTVAANLAAAFAAMGKKTGLLDADIYGASQPRMMGIRFRPEKQSDDLIIPPTAHGIKVMSMGFFVDETAPVIWRGPMVHSAIQQLLRDVAWGDLDVLVIDLPPGTGDAQLSLAQNTPLSGAVIVSTPQDVALSEAEKGLHMFQKVKVPVLGIIENMSYHVCLHCGHREDIFTYGGARAAAARLSVPFLGEIPLQSAVRAAADAGMPIVLADPTHPTSEAFKNIAARIWCQNGVAVADV